MSAAESSAEPIPPGRKGWWGWNVRFATWIRIFALLPVILSAAEFARQYYAAQQQAAEIARMKEVAESDRILAQMIHAMEAERGRSVLYPAGSSAGAGQEQLREARRAVDQRIAAAHAWAQKAGRRCCIAEAAVAGIEAEVTGLRKGVDAGADPLAVVADYGGVIHRIFDFQTRLNKYYTNFERQRGGGVEATILWIRALLDLKEVIGQQRALVGLGLTRRAAGGDIMEWGIDLVQLMAREQEVANVFRSSAPPDILARLTDQKSTVEERQMQRIGRRLVEAMNGGKRVEVYDPESWFDLASHHMDRIARLIDGLYDSLQSCR